MSRLIIVSNRLPVTLDRRHGELLYHPSAGGLATGLNSLETDMERVWIGWPGHTVEDEFEQESVTYQLAKDNMAPVFLSKRDMQLFYEGFSNRTIWPHFHYFTQYTSYQDDYWDAYQRVNQIFAEKIREVVKPDDILWIHDYQLLLVPGMVREFFPDLTIGFFLHIPFPSFEIFRTLPWRHQLLTGMLGSDLIGFHTFGYMRHFLSSVYRIIGNDHSFGKLQVGNRSVSVDVFPMGIDYNRFANLEPEESTSEEIRHLQKLTERHQLIISIDRLDYSKGIPHRIRAFDLFLRRNPKYHGRVTLILVVVPSRSNVDQYRQLKEEIDELVGRINGQFGTFNWTPIRYYYRSFPFQSLNALYQASDIALITPLRDGMNLVAKEYVASKEKSLRGVLILSEMAGAANDLPEALLVNPNDMNQISDALLTALEMDPGLQASSLREMQAKLKKYDVKHWANNFLRQLLETRREQFERQTKLLNYGNKERLVNHYFKAEKRLLLLDYDGTLVGFHDEPGDAHPDAELRETLKKLHNDPRNTVVIISGRDRYTLGDWFGDLGIEIVSEHGVWLWKNNHWHLNEGISASWKSKFMPVLENLVERTPGSFVEEKDFTLAWHYRKIDGELGANRVREIRDQLVYLIANHDLQVLEGNKVVEIRNSGVNKGKAASMWLARENWDFVMAIGDDHTDEDTFRALPSTAYSVKVGLNRTHAQYKVRSVEEVRSLLDLLVHQEADKPAIS